VTLLLGTRCEHVMTMATMALIAMILCDKREEGNRNNCTDVRQFHVESI